MPQREDHCKGCDKRILWIKTAQGGWAPIDPEVITIYDRDTRRIHRGWIPHHATCKMVEQFRKKK